jgi:hypothetical protein
LFFVFSSAICSAFFLALSTSDCLLTTCNNLISLPADFAITFGVI